MWNIYVPGVSKLFAFKIVCIHVTQKHVIRIENEGIVCTYKLK